MSGLIHLSGRLRESLDLLHDALLVVARPEPMVIAGKLHETRPSDGRSEMTPGLDAHRAITDTMEDQRRGADARQEMSHIRVAHGPQDARQGSGAGCRAQ